MLPDYTGYVSYSQTSAVQCSAVPLVWFKSDCLQWKSDLFPQFYCCDAMSEKKIHSTVIKVKAIIFVQFNLRNTWAKNGYFQ
jgi:hypothetical protein